MATLLHEARLDLVRDHVCGSGARSVLDLGCGDGELLARMLAVPQFERIIGLDINADALTAARERLQLAAQTTGRLELRQASFEDEDQSLRGFDAAVLLETIEHIRPDRLARVEAAVFGCYRPPLVLVTTPNVEYNVLCGMRPGVRRHAGHYFEWDRARFRRWAGGVAHRHGYDAFFVDIGDADPRLGAPTQMARFELRRNAQ